jgi:hypothetical protein
MAVGGVEEINILIIGWQRSITELVLAQFPSSLFVYGAGAVFGRQPLVLFDLFLRRSIFLS